MFSTESITNHEHQFPSYRAFVIQFSTNTQLGENCFNGRVENIVSGGVSHVFSVIRLLQFLQRTLESDTEPECAFVASINHRRLKKIILLER